MLLAVLDTNTVVSALLFRGVTNILVSLWQNGKFIPVVSKEIVEEYLKVFAYPKFGLSDEEVKNLIEHQLLPFARPVIIKNIPKVVSEDPSDNAFLGCAHAGKCKYLVSGDHHLLDLKSYKGISIISAGTFLSKINH